MCQSFTPLIGPNLIANLLELNPRLEVLQLQHMVTDKGVREIVRQCPESLRDLSLKAKLSEDSLSEVMSLPQLEKFSLHHAVVENVSFHVGTSLQYLCFAKCIFEDVALAEVVRKSPLLETLIFSDCTTCGMSPRYFLPASTLRKLRDAPKPRLRSIDFQGMPYWNSWELYQNYRACHRGDADGMDAVRIAAAEFIQSAPTLDHFMIYPYMSRGAPLIRWTSGGSMDTTTLVK